MNRRYAARRKRMRLKKFIDRFMHRLGTAVLIILGFILAAFLGVLAGRLFGVKVIVDGDAMSPTIEENAAVRVNQLIYKITNPDRLDIIVFDLDDSDEGTLYYVRRVVGLPGETIQIIDGQIYVDGNALEFSFNTEYIEDAGICSEAITLDDDEYFVIGDNYNDCYDSRSSAIGIIEKDQILGKAG